MAFSAPLLACIDVSTLASQLLWVQQLFLFYKGSFCLEVFYFSLVSFKPNHFQCQNQYTPVRSILKRIEILPVKYKRRGFCFTQQFTCQLGYISSPGYCPAQKPCDGWRETQRWARRMVKENKSYEGRPKECDLFSLEVKQRRLRKCKQKKKKKSCCLEKKNNLFFMSPGDGARNDELTWKQEEIRS